MTSTILPGRTGMRAASIGSSFESLDALASRVLGGEVVFFLGAGFSIASEGNTAARLIARLLARLLAMGTCLAQRPGGEAGQGLALLDGMGRVFKLEHAPQRSSDARALEPVRCMTAANVKLLAREYYSFNDWATSALGLLARELLSRPGHAPVARNINRLENLLLTTLGGDDAPLESVEWTVLRRFKRDVDLGKALFLDTMGFANPDVMAGDPRNEDIERVAESYLGRLRPRHHALARLAREGLLPTVVTTNYDLLLEGAYRLAGFVDRGDDASPPKDVPQTTVPRFSCIAGADQFFARGGQHRTALVFKIHGCAAIYRTERLKRPKNGPVDAWTRYLPSLVFTYREIQTWRNDAWSRDLIRTLLRTRTLALCGYSGADPILHSTIREVYEEMAGAPVSCSPRAAAGGAPAFFFGVAGQREFHGPEILRAASEAHGVGEPPLVDHPNQIEFAIDGTFPSLDDQMQWLSHLVVREMQRRALRSRLRRLVPRMLGASSSRRLCPDVDIRSVCDTFDRLCDSERRCIVSASAESRARVFDRIVGWTWHFVPGFLRELALADLVDERRGPGGSMRALRLWPWYFPVSERPDWSAWAAVVEIAVRRIVAAWRTDVAAVDPGDEWIAAEDSRHAAVSFSRGRLDCRPRALCIRLGGFERTPRGQDLAGAFRQVRYWELEEHEVPWPDEPDSARPCATELWQWALGTHTKLNSAAAARLLGDEA